jgi:ATP-dependent DNA helicase PIF1
MTLDAAEIDLSKTFEPGQGYVALSRVKSIEGLRLMGINDMALKVDGLILQINGRMKSASERASDEIKSFSEKEIEEKSLEFIKKSGGTVKKEEIKKEKVKIEKEKKEIKEKIKRGEVVVEKEDIIPS